MKTFAFTLTAAWLLTASVLAQQPVTIAHVQDPGVTEPILDVDSASVLPASAVLSSPCSCGVCPTCCSDCCSDGCAFGGLFGDVLTNTGAELRFRYHNERGMFGGRFTPATYDALLTRLRVWGDVQLMENVAFHTEGFFADSTTNDGFRPIDRNHGEARNMYMQLGLTDNLAARLGRQDFLYGAQRVISPLDWANTRRAFDGAKLVYTGLEDWQLDAFYGNLVRVVVDGFDRSNYDVSLYGLYGVYKGLDKSQIEPYYIGFDHQALGFSRHMFGARVNGTGAGGLLYEAEAAYQFGQDTGDSVSECFFTLGAGGKLGGVLSALKPTVWCYMDYATGDAGNNRAGNVGYNEVFPLTHKYLGFIDSVLRSNIIAPNVLMTMAPCDRVKFLVWYYHFRAENDGAIVPGVGNAPQVTGAGRRHLGDELDLLSTLKLNERNTVLFGYSHFWAGSRITGPNDADFFYIQHTFSF